MASVPSPFASFPTCGDENTIDGGRGGRVLAPSSRPVPRLVSRFASRLVLLACLVGPRCLIVSSSHPFVSSAPLCPSCLLPARPLASPHRLIGSAHRLVPCLVSPGSPSHRQGRRGDTGFLIGGRAVACLCGGRLWAGASLRSSWSVCLPRGGGRLGRFLFLSSAHPIDKASATARLIPSAHRLIDGDVPLVFFFFSSFPLTPSCRLFSACLPGACSPVPGRGMCGPGRGLRRRVWGLVCLLAIVSVSLTRSRSFARCYMPRLVALRCPIWGVVGRFAGYSARLPVGVGVFQYMPLNRILWLLTGIFGDGVRCPFSALPAGPSSSLRHASCPLPAAVSWRLCGRFLW